MHDNRVPAVLAVAVLALTLLIATPSRAGGTSAGPASHGYLPPVDAPIAEGFSLPDGPYGKGNRGVDYVVTAGTTVRASNDGEVIFAGPVAGSLHVTVKHPDGLRTSYSFLASIDVRVGGSVAAGDRLGSSGTLLHFGVRDGTDTYLDPVGVFDGSVRARPRLVPGTEEGRPDLVAEERRGFLEVVLSAGEVVLPGIAGGPERWRVLAHYGAELQPLTRTQHLIDGYVRWKDSQRDCTPPSVSPPGRTERRILVLVAGFGSTSTSAGVDKVDAASLGYASGDVVRFSYRGGRIPSAPLAPRARRAAHQRLRRSRQPAGSRRHGRPTLPVPPADRRGRTRRADRRRRPFAGRGGQPLGGAALRRHRVAPGHGRDPGHGQFAHGGADLATALNGVSAVAGADSTLEVLQDTLGLRLDANSPAVAELSEVSPLADDLRGRGVPDRLHFVSIGARGDLVVANPRTVVAGEASVIVDTSGIHAHDQVPGSTQVTREIALAVAGEPPTCSSFGDAMVDLVAGESISWAEDGLGASGLVLTAPFP